MARLLQGDQVVASTQSEAYKRIKTFYNDTLALEMESIGFARAVATHSHIQAINIRSISDLLDGKNAKRDAEHQPLAADHAAAFAFELLDHLDFINLKFKHMDAKTIAKQIVSIIFPFLQLDSIKLIGKEFRQATDGTIQEIWEKVRPIFIEEVEAEDTPEEAQVAIRSSLRKELEKNDELKQQMAALLKQVEKTDTGSKVIITDSKNVVQGSNIHVGGDFQVGDNS